jgi:hypothetical protein
MERRTVAGGSLRSWLTRTGWLAGLTAIGVLAIVPATLIATDLARWDDAGNPDAAHHAASVVGGRLSPLAVDSDEVGIHLVLGLFVAVWLLAAGLAWYLALRRWLRLRIAAAIALAVLALLWPSAAYWASWPTAG